MSKKKVLITVGGTGGHIYPAIALAHDLSDCDLLFVGGGLKTNRYFSQHLFAYAEVACGTFSFSKPWKAFSGMLKILKGIYQSSKILKQFQPDLVVGFGSYYTLPLLIAAKLKGLPIVLHEANRIPGRVNKLFSRYATVTGIHFPDTKLTGKIQHIAMPLRKGFEYGTIAQSQARAHFQLNPSKKTILVFGGSQGAHAINKAILAALPLVHQNVQILHIAGDQKNAENLMQEYSKMPFNYCVKAFETRMDLAWQAADVAICRSGASTIAEAIEFQVPSLFIPFPNAVDNHQEYNADFVAEKIGGGKRLREKDLSPTIIAALLSKWLEDHAPTYIQMKAALHQYKSQTQASKLSDVIGQMLKSRNSP